MRLQLWCWVLDALCWTRLCRHERLWLWAVRHAGAAVDYGDSAGPVGPDPWEGEW